MTIHLNPDAKRLIERQLESGRYATAEDVVLAALATLEHHEFYFEPGELDALIAEGDESIRREGTFDADKVFAELERMSAERRGQQP